eukprot:6180000-Pleurochrysis_carterae.AAC.2
MLHEVEEAIQKGEAACRTGSFMLMQEAARAWKVSDPSAHYTSAARAAASRSSCSHPATVRLRHSEMKAYAFEVKSRCVKKQFEGGRGRGWHA